MYNISWRLWLLLLQWCVYRLKRDRAFKMSPRIKENRRLYIYIYVYTLDASLVRSSESPSKTEEAETDGILNVTTILAWVTHRVRLQFITGPCPRCWRRRANRASQPASQPCVWSSHARMDRSLSAGQWWLLWTSDASIIQVHASCSWSIHSVIRVYLALTVFRQ